MTQTQPEDAVETLRERTYTWSDPAATAAGVGTTTGLEFLAMMERGEVPPPPILHTLAFTGFTAEAGSVSFTLTPQEFHYNPIGSVHGGVIATMLDSATGCAVHSVLGQGEGYTSLDLTVKYLRPVTTATGEITAVGTVVSRGSRTALAEGRLSDARGRILAHATSSCLIFPVPPRA